MAVTSGIQPVDNGPLADGFSFRRPDGHLCGRVSLAALPIQRRDERGSVIEASQAGDVLPTVLAGPGYNGATMHYSSDVHLEFRDANGETFKISHMWPNRIAFSGPRPTEKRGVVRMEVDGEPQEWPVELAVSTCFDDSVLIVRDW